MFDDLDENQLIALAQSGNTDALEAVLHRFKKITVSFSRRFFLAGGTSDDLVQEGMIGLLKAINSYDYAQGSPFGAYAYSCVKGAVLDAIKGAQRGKHQPLNGYISFSVSDFGTEGLDPEILAIEAEDSNRLHTLRKKVLSEGDSNILQLYLEGFSYFEIAEKVDRTVKYIDNAIQRVKKQLKSALIQKKVLS